MRSTYSGRGLWLILFGLVITLVAACTGGEQSASPPLDQAYPTPQKNLPSAAYPLPTPAAPPPGRSEPETGEGAIDLTSPILHSKDWSPAPGDARLERGPVIIEESIVSTPLAASSSYSLYLIGTLPDPCHKLRVKVSPVDAQGMIQVEAYSIYNPEEMCIQVIESFQAEVGLVDYVSGQTTVWVNGEPAPEALP